VAVPSWRKPGQPLGTTVVQRACKQAAANAKLTKRVYPHLLRHCFASESLGDTDLLTLQALLGHVDLKQTSRYVHISTKHLANVTSPFDLLENELN